MNSHYKTINYLKQGYKQGSKSSRKKYWKNREAIYFKKSKKQKNLSRNNQRSEKRKSNRNEGLSENTKSGKEQIKTSEQYKVKIRTLKEKRKTDFSKNTQQTKGVLTLAVVQDSSQYKHNTYCLLKRDQDSVKR